MSKFDVLYEQILINEKALTASEINVDSLSLSEVVAIYNKYLRKLSEGGGGGDAILRKTNIAGVYKDVDGELADEKTLRKELKQLLTAKNDDNYDYVMGYDTPRSKSVWDAMQKKKKA